jgi:hypothetical protein
MPCGIVSGLACATCEDLQSVGGIKAKNIYVGSLSDLTDSGFTTDSEGVVTAIGLQPYNYLYKFCAKTKSAGASQELVTGENNIKSFTQTITGKFQQQTQDAKNVWDNLKLIDDLFVVVEKTNGTFELYGKDAGLEITALTKATGVLIGDDNAFNITLSQPMGGEQELAPDFFVTSYQATKAYLESRIS